MEITFDSIQFFSNFNSGNLGKVEKVPGKLLKSSEEFWDAEFNLWTKPDASGTLHENLNRTWFYFGISGVPLNHCLKINIVNLNKQRKLYNQGYAPLYKTVPSTREKWERIKEKISYEQSNTGLVLSFTHTFNIPSSTTYFAFAYPWSYLECQEKLNHLDEVFKYCNNLEQSRIFQRSIYYYRELLCLSMEGCRVDLITVSDCSGITKLTEARFDKNLFPDIGKPRCKEFPTKKVFFLTSRVHPGETPSSHVFNGFLDFILRENDARAEQLRRKYVFKLIPMLNPDGVARGHYRTDSMGVNLNRVYLDPTFELYPSIYAAKSLLVYYHCKNSPLWLSISEKFNKITNNKEKAPKKKSVNLIEESSGTLKNDVNQTSDASQAAPNDMETISIKELTCHPIHHLENELDIITPHLCNTQLLDISPRESGVAFYIDLHAHASKKGCFFYGNHFSELENQIECLTYAKLVSLNTAHFDFMNCNFTEKNMYAPDKRENSTKEGSGRVAIYKHLGIVHCYTLECNYNMDRVVNHIPASVGDKGRTTPPLPIGTPPQKYTIAHFEEVGRALGVAALDIIDSNPWSRIIQSEFINSNGVRDFIKRTHPALKCHPANRAATSASLQQLPTSPANAVIGKSWSTQKCSPKCSTSAPPPARAISLKPVKQSLGHVRNTDYVYGTNSCPSAYAKAKNSKHSFNKR